MKPLRFRSSMFIHAIEAYSETDWNNFGREKIFRSKISTIFLSHNGILGIFRFFQSPPTEQSLQHIFETRFRIIIESTRAYSRIYSNIEP